MRFSGIQKLTLLDYPDKTACTLFTTGCNYRCPYCHNASIVCPSDNSPGIEATEILDFLSSRQGLLDGVCISGGEPLMHPDLKSFVGQVRDLGFSVKLDTNGSFPDALKDLAASGLLDYIAMDVKNSPDMYAKAVGLSGVDLSPVQESVTFLLSGLIPYEFRTTVVRQLHTADDLVSIAHWIFGAERYYLQSFVYSEGVMQSGLSGYSGPEMRQLLNHVKAVLPRAELRGA